MGYEVTWKITDAIILVRLWGDLDIQEFPEFDRLILQHLAQSDRQLVHIWIDLKEVTKFPNNIRQVQKALTHKDHPQVGWSLVITDNRIIRFVGYMITQLAKARFRAFSTDEDARAFLQMIDQELVLEVTNTN